MRDMTKSKKLYETRVPKFCIHQTVSYILGGKIETAIILSYKVSVGSLLYELSVGVGGQTFEPEEKLYSTPDEAKAALIIEIIRQ